MHTGTAPHTLALDLLPCGVLIADAEGAVLEANSAARALLGLDTPQDTQVVLCCEDGEVGLTELLSDHASGPIVRRRVHLKHPDHGWLHATLTRMAGADGTPQAHAVIERGQGQDWRLAGRSDPLAAFAHELRNALTSLREGLALVLEGAAGELGDVQRHLLDGVREDADRMARLSDDIVAANRVRAGRVRVMARNLDPAELVRTAVRSFGPTAAKAHVHLTAGPTVADMACYADKDLLTQALGNLVSNAVKFTPPDGTVTVSAARTTDASGEEYLELAVRDTGAGLSAEQLGRLEHGGNDTTAPPPQTHRDGLGIGLSIVREIAEQHGGRLEVESEQGTGSCFRLLVPSDFRRSERWLLAQVSDAIKLAKAVGAPLSVVELRMVADDEGGGLWATERGLVQLPLIEHCIEESLRPSDTVVINESSATLVLQTVDSPSARLVAERTVAKLEHLLATLPEPCPRCTLALGVASYPADGDTASQVVARARRDVHDVHRPPHHAAQSGHSTAPDHSVCPVHHAGARQDGG